jgi:hypothetical protein
MMADDPEHKRRRLHIKREAALTISLFGTLVAIITIFIFALLALVAFGVKVG